VLDFVAAPSRRQNRQKVKSRLVFDILLARGIKLQLEPDGNGRSLANPAWCKSASRRL